jgi:hypothetical protein
MSQIFGSSVNLFASNSKSKTPEIGMGGTVLMWSDRHAVTVTRINTDKKITVTRDIVKRVDTNGMSESQIYEYTPDPTHRITYTFTLRKDGRWKELGGTNPILILGHKEEYYDYSF